FGHGVNAGNSLFGGLLRCRSPTVTSGDGGIPGGNRRRLDDGFYAVSLGEDDGVRRSVGESTRRRLSGSAVSDCSWFRRPARSGLCTGKTKTFVSSVRAFGFYFCDRW